MSSALYQDRVLWRTAGALAAVAIVFAVLNHAGQDAARKANVDETLIQHEPAERPSFADRWEQAERESYQSDEAFWNGSEEASADTQDITGAIATGAAPGESTVRLSSLESVDGDMAANSRQRDVVQLDVVQLDEVEQYLWEVYQRVPTKRDSSGDFTWKDPAAAKRLGMPLPVYVIRGMDPDFREQLYHAGRAMDAAGLKWSMLSAFRDDYRQHLASGFKASGGNSLHGGSARTGGYGHGRAVDVTSMDEDAGPVWRWLDAHGAKYGLHRPMPGVDPPHVQSRGEWRELAAALRHARIKTAQTSGPDEGPSAKAKVIASASK